MTIRIKGKEYTLKSSFRSYMIYENITGKSFEPTTMTDIINFFFCVVITICVVALMDASTARLKIEQLFKYYWTVVSGLAAISLVLAWYGL